MKSNEEIERDPNFLRGKYLLQNRFSDVSELFKFWMITKYHPSGPWPERRQPWWEGFEGIFFIPFE